MKQCKAAGEQLKREPLCPILPWLQTCGVQEVFLQFAHATKPPGAHPTSASEYDQLACTCSGGAALFAALAAGAAAESGSLGEGEGGPPCLKAAAQHSSEAGPVAAEGQPAGVEKVEWKQGGEEGESGGGGAGRGMGWWESASSLDEVVKVGWKCWLLLRCHAPIHEAHSHAMHC